MGFKGIVVCGSYAALYLPWSCVRVCVYMQGFTNENYTKRIRSYPVHSSRRRNRAKYMMFSFTIDIWNDLLKSPAWMNLRREWISGMKEPPVRNVPYYFSTVSLRRSLWVGAFLVRTLGSGISISNFMGAATTVLLRPIVHRVWHMTAIVHWDRCSHLPWAMTRRKIVHEI